MVYDSVGKDTFVRSLDCLRPFGLAANFGNASGKVPPIDMGLLAAKGSLYVTRPTLFTHIAAREATQAMADDLFGMVGSGAGEDPHRPARYALKDAAQAHRDLEARKTTGCSVLPLERIQALAGFPVARSSALASVRCSWTSRRSIQVSGCRRPSGSASTGPRMGSSSMRDSW